MTARRVSLDVPQEPPPPYEPLGPSTSTSGVSTGITPAVAASNTNPFLAPGEAAAISSGSVPNLETLPPALPPRNPVALGALPSPSIPGPSVPDRVVPPRTSPSSVSAVSPPLLSSSSSQASQYRPPSGPPPLRTSASSSNAASSRLGSHGEYRPTTTPTPGQPLLRKGKLLMYPNNWSECPKCNDTGYKQGDPSNPCKKCWDKYGKTYTSAVSYSVGLNNASSHLQKPLPGRPVPTRPIWSPPASQELADHCMTGQVQAAPTHAGVYRPPPQSSPSAQRPRRSENPVDDGEDAETVGSRMSDIAPSYQDASNVPHDEHLPSQYVPPVAPPPGQPGSHRPPSHRPAPGTLHQGQQGDYQQPHAPLFHAAYHQGPHQHLPPPGFGGPFVGGFSPYPGGPNPQVQFGPSGMRAPPGALVVMPGDPRIGGRLCHECGGRGETESFWFGSETCLRCRGSGRVF